ncbi:MAG: hypothetical protein L3J92_07120 [Thermoplasmata archaeon]|jgi:hypothetical protein|nr:hypothetical protein [Thermoplasmata archaeon]
MTNSGRTTRGLWGRRIGFTGGAALAVSLLILLPSAANATPTFTLKAPFSGTTYADEGASFEGCGGNATWAIAPFFNLTNGHAHESVSALTPACKKQYSSTGVYTEAALVTTSFKLATGSHSIKAKWTASFSIDLVASPGKSPQTAYAYDEVYVYGWTYDETNDSYVESTYSSYVDNYTYNGSVVHSFHDVTLWMDINGTYASGHVYYLVTYFAMDVETDASAGHSTASAQVNGGTSGERAALDSIKAS